MPSEVPPARGRASTWAARAAGASVLVAAAFATAALFRIVRSEHGLPLWDEAAQGFAGLEAARAIGHARPLEFLAVLNRQVVWPFVHALLLLPGFALFGPDLETPALVSALLFGATATLAFASGLALHPTRGPWVGLLAAALLLASPAYRVFGTLGMLEIPGAFLLALTIALHVRCAAPTASRSQLVAAGITTAALFLLKYNYGLLWLAALMANEWFRLAPDRRAHWRARAAGWVRAGGLLRPWPLFLAVYIAALAAILVTGGFEFAALGRRISIHSPGNAAYALLVLCTVWTAGAIARDPERWRARWRALSVRHRVLLATIGAPLLLWFLMPWPNRVRALADFVANRSSGPSPWSLAGLLYYPRAFASDYSPSAAVGWVALAVALVPPPRAQPGPRLLYIALAVGFEGTVAHHYHHPRFFFTVALLVWLNAARAATGMVAALLARAPRGLRVPVSAVALAATLIALRPPADARVREDRRAFRTSETLLPVLDRVLDLAAGERERSVLLGYSYALSPGLLSWRARQVRPELSLRRLPKRAPWLPANASEAAIASRLDRLLVPGSLVVAALPTPRSPAHTPAYADEVWADSVTAERLASDPRVAEETDAAEHVAAFRLSAFRVAAR